MDINEQVKKLLIEHDLNFTINKLPLSGTNESGESLITPYYGLFNSTTGECINTAKDGYTVSQNGEVLEMALTGIQKFGDKLSVSKAGSINGGRRVFIQLAIDGVQKLGDDTMTQYITIIDSNDGSTGLSVGVGTEQAHCFNQFFRFYKEGNSRFRHTATITQKIQEIPMLIETALDAHLKQIRTFKRFLSTPLTKHLADKMVKEVLGYDRVVTSIADQAKMTKRSTEMMDLMYQDIKTEQEYYGNNVMAIFQGVTRYTTHHQKPPKRTNGLDESLMVGVGYGKAESAYKFCLSHLS